MEKDREIIKLMNVLRRVARAAEYAAWTAAQPDAARFCVAQYNKVLGRLAELEPGITGLFTPLGQEAAPEVTRMAARELAAYFEDEAPTERRYAGTGCGSRRVWVGWAATPRRVVIKRKC
jgi:hypothetical protein